MTTVYRIAKWDEIFETAESKRIKNLTWVSWPIDLDSRGYHLMLDEFGVDTPTMYGTWAALVCLAATCPVRGVLADKRGEPFSIAWIARKTHMPADCFDKLIRWASTDGVAWLEVTTMPSGWLGDNQRIPSESPALHEHGHEHGPLPRPSVRPGSCADENGVIVVTEECWPELVTVIARIARVVTGNRDVEVTRLRAADRKLATKAAAISKFRYGDEWLNEILEGIASRTEPLPKPWGYFRGALVRSARELFDEEYRDVERLVKQAPRKAPA